MDHHDGTPRDTRKPGFSPNRAQGGTQGRAPGSAPRGGSTPSKEGGRSAQPRPAYRSGPRPQGGDSTQPRPAYRSGPRPQGGDSAQSRPAYRSGPRPQGGDSAQPRPAYRSGPRPQGGDSAQPRPAYRSGPRPQGDRPSRPAPGFRPPYKPGAPVRSQTPPPPTPVTETRRLALLTLLDVQQRQAYAAIALDKRLESVPQMKPEDKRLATSIVYRTLENQIMLDYALDRLLTDPARVDETARVILRMGACQILLYDRVPDNAAVDECVKLTRLMNLEYLTGMVNAVLREMSRRKDALQWPAPEEGAHHLSIMYSAPEWLAQRLLDAYGPETAKDILSYRTEHHTLTIRVNRLQTTADDLAARLTERGVVFTPGIIPGAFYVSQSMAIGEDADFRKGLFSVQGEGSMIAALAVSAGRGMQVLDACAAPGGKSALLAECMGMTGRIYAWDIHDHRVDLTRATMRRLRIDSVRPALRDASVPREDMRMTLDRVLIDAPCSGLGVMDDKPDVKYRVTPDSVKELIQTQRAILDACCEYVKPGGLLIYSTCSLLPEENKDQIAAFVQRHPDFTVKPLPDAIPESLRIHEDALGLQLLPHRDHTEGFYVAVLQRDPTLRAY